MTLTTACRLFEMGVPVKHKRIKPRRVKHPAHMARVAAQGCLVCKRPAEVHHVRTGNQGKDDARVVPLCPEYHRGAKGFHGLGSDRAFLDEYGISLSLEAERLAMESKWEGIL